MSPPEPIRGVLSHFLRHLSIANHPKTQGEDSIGVLHPFSVIPPKKKKRESEVSSSPQRVSWFPLILHHQIVPDQNRWNV